jgi:hypothetical protein
MTLRLGRDLGGGTHAVASGIIPAQAGIHLTAVTPFYILGRRRFM